MMNLVVYSHEVAPRNRGYCTLILKTHTVQLKTKPRQKNRWYSQNKWPRKGYEGVLAWVALRLCLILRMTELHCFLFNVLKIFSKLFRQYVHSFIFLFFLILLKTMFMQYVLTTVLRFPYSHVHWNHTLSFSHLKTNKH